MMNKQCDSRTSRQSLSLELYDTMIRAHYPTTVLGLNEFAILSDIAVWLLRALVETIEENKKVKGY